MRSGDLLIENVAAQIGGLVGVQLTHLPTGKKVVCAQYSTREKNGEAALKQLAESLRPKG